MAVNLLLIGRSGNGKSSTGNSILGDKVFISKENSLSSIDVKRSKVDDKIITVVDGPCVKDTSLDNPGDINLALECAKKAMGFCAEGFHAVIIVLKYGIRYTQQEKDAVILIRAMFGDKVIRDHGIFVFTCGDAFMSDEEGERISFETWCKNQTGDIAALFKECNYRCLIFNNRARDEEQKRRQRGDLLALVDKFKGSRYTFEQFEQAKGGRVSLVVTSKRPRLEEETRRVLNEISVVLKQTDIHRKPESSKVTLLSLKRKIEDHKTYLQREAAGTELLKIIFDEISLTESNLDTKLAIIDQGLQRLQHQGLQHQDSTTHPSGNWILNLIFGIYRRVCNFLRNFFARQ